MRKLQIDQLNQKMLEFEKVRSIKVSNQGWVHTIRTTLGMSLEQLGKKLSLTKASVGAIEKREAEGSITLKSLREAALALDMELVYGFVPIEGTLHNHIERKAESLASKIVYRTSHSMKLEDQENSQQRLAKAIQERKEEIIREMPKALWD
jgi:predicted DNA-binding mobile mystery protein A